MPSYRPKSLEELNNMYDKKLAAESAMRKGSSHIKDESVTADATPPAYEPYTYDSSKYIKETEEPPVTDISGAVNEFIKTFGQTQEKKVAPQTIHPIQTRVTSKKIPSTAPAHAKQTAPVKKKKPPTPAKRQERTVLVRNDERSELMDDYKKIMMDEDEDKLSLKERLAMKKKSKAEKKEADKADKATKKEQKKAAEEVKKLQTDSTEEKQKAAELQPKEKADELVIIESEEISVIAESFINENISVNAAEERLAQEEDFSEREPGQEVEQYVQQTDDNFSSDASDSVQEYEDDPYEALAADDTEYPAQENYEEEYEHQQEIFESFAYADTKEKSKGKAGRVISLLLVIVMLLLTACTGALKYVVNIDTGKAFMGKYYVFTAKERLLYAGISVGDLVISEEKAVGSEDAFVYFDNTSFRFARPSDISPSNSYVIIAENDNEQVLASTENIRGVVKFTVPFIGRVLGFVSSNFMVVFITLSGICLLLIIITAILFAKGRKRQIEAVYSIDDEYDDDGYEAQQDNNAEESYTDEASSEAYSDEEYENDSLPMENEHYFSDEPDDMDERAYLPDQSGQEIQAELISEYPEQQEASEETVYELDDEEE